MSTVNGSGLDTWIRGRKVETLDTALPAVLPFETGMAFPFRNRFAKYSFYILRKEVVYCEIVFWSYIEKKLPKCTIAINTAWKNWLAKILKGRFSYVFLNYIMFSTNCVGTRGKLFCRKDGGYDSEKCILPFQYSCLVIEWQPLSRKTTASTFNRTSWPAVTIWNCPKNSGVN